MTPTDSFIETKVNQHAPDIIDTSDTHVGLDENA
jgi:hypothetical protein